MVDESKLSDVLGTNWHIPIEVVPLAGRPRWASLPTWAQNPVRRTNEDGTPTITDQHNYIIDANFGRIADPERLGSEAQIPHRDR